MAELFKQYVHSILAIKFRIKLLFSIESHPFTCENDMRVKGGTIKKKLCFLSIIQTKDISFRIQMGKTVFSPLVDLKTKLCHVQK